LRQWKIEHEKYLLSRFGASIGLLGKVSFLMVPTGLDTLGEGFSLSEADDAGYRALSDRKGAVAVS
jgi:hypothetical protein